MQTLADDHATTVQIPIPDAPIDLVKGDVVTVEEIPDAAFTRC